MTALLLVFVAATLVKLALDSSVGEEPGASAVTETEAALIVNYFHTDVRCWNCNTIERFTQETLRERFVDELDSGSIEWRVANIDEAENDHFTDDYELVTSSVVLVEIARSGGEDWKNLGRVWDLVHEEQEFKAYVEDGVRALLEGQP